MGRPLLHPIRVPVKFAAEDYDRLKAAAVRDGVPTAVFIRQAALEALSRRPIRQKGA